VVRIVRPTSTKTEEPLSVSGIGSDVVCQFVACSGFQPVATTPVHGAVKYRAALRTDEMGITGAFATLAVLEAIISHGARSLSARRRSPFDLQRKSFCIDASSAAPGQSAVYATLASAWVGVAFISCSSLALSST